jgi:hypothetical protein
MFLIFKPIYIILSKEDSLDRHSNTRGGRHDASTMPGKVYRWLASGQRDCKGRIELSLTSLAVFVHSIP